MRWVDSKPKLRLKRSRGSVKRLLEAHHKTHICEILVMRSNSLFHEFINNATLKLEILDPSTQIYNPSRLTLHFIRVSLSRKQSAFMNAVLIQTIEGFPENFECVPILAGLTSRSGVHFPLPPLQAQKPAPIMSGLENTI